MTTLRTAFVAVLVFLSALCTPTLLAVEILVWRVTKTNPVDNAERNRMAHNQGGDIVRVERDGYGWGRLEHPTTDQAAEGACTYALLRVSDRATANIIKDYTKPRWIDEGQEGQRLHTKHNYRLRLGALSARIQNAIADCVPVPVTAAELAAMVRNKETRVNEGLPSR